MITIQSSADLESTTIQIPSRTNCAFCVALNRAAPENTLASVFTVSESVYFPQNCVICGELEPLRGLKVGRSARWSRRFQLDGKAPYCRRHAAGLWLRRWMTGLAILLGLGVGGVSYWQEWLVVGSLEVGLIVWPAAFGVMGLLLAGAAGGLIGVARGSRKSTMPVEVVAIDEDFYVLAFHRRGYYEDFLLMNEESILKPLGEVEVTSDFETLIYG